MQYGVGGYLAGLPIGRETHDAARGTIAVEMAAWTYIVRDFIVAKKSSYHINHWRAQPLQTHRKFDWVSDLLTERPMNTSVDCAPYCGFLPSSLTD